MADCANLFAFASNNNKPEPKFEKGEDVYYVMADTAFKCVVLDVFEMNRDSDGAFLRYGYNLRHEKYDNTIRIWQDCDVDNIFQYFMDAKEKCNENFKKIQIYTFFFSDVIEMKMFKEYRDHPYRTKADFVEEYGYVMLLNDNIVIYKETQTYAFAKMFWDAEAAKIFYDIIVKKQYDRMKEVNCCEQRNQDDFIEINPDSFHDKIERRFYLCDQTNGTTTYSELEHFYHNRFKHTT